MIGKRKIAFGIVLCLVFLTSVGVNSVVAIDLPSLDEIEQTSITAFSGQKSVSNPKMDSGINRIVNDYEREKSRTIKAMSSGSQAPEKKKCITVKTPPIVDNRVKVYLDLENKEDINELQAKYDLSDTDIITTSFSETAQANVRVDDLEKLASEDSVKSIRVPVMAMKANPEPKIDDIDSVVTSEGIAEIQADQLHRMNITGAGTEIAIIDLGFFGFKNPEINSDNIKEIKSFREDAIVDSVPHGAACAEIFSDVAPEADINLCAINTQMEFVESVEYAISKNIPVISCSLFFVGGGNKGDDISCQAINKARENNIIPIVCGGNYRDKHYLKKYADTDNDDWHEFGPGDETQDLGLFKEGDEVTIALTWENPNEDYDLYLLGKGSDGYVEGVSSKDIQEYTKIPAERIDATINDNVVLYIAIVKKNTVSKETDGKLELFSSAELQYITPENSITSPGAASGAITIGAVDIDGIIADYSPLGKINFVGISPVSTWIYNPFKMDGTSAATPLVAGAFALLKSAFPEATNEQILQALQETALDLKPEGWDEKNGHGLPLVYDAFLFLQQESEMPENSTINQTVNSNETVMTP